MATAEVRLGYTVHGAARGQSQLLDEDIHSIGTSNSMHAVKQNLEVLVGAQEFLNEVEIKDLLHHVHIVSSRVDDLNLQWTVGLGANVGSVDIGNIRDLERDQILRVLENLVGDRLRGRSSISKVILDSKVGIRT